MPVPTILAGTSGALLATPQGSTFDVERIDRLPKVETLSDDAVLVVVDGPEGARGGVNILWGALRGQVDPATEERLAAIEEAIEVLGYIAPKIAAFTAAPAAVEKGASVASVVLSVTRNRMDLPVAITGAATATIPAGQPSITVPGPFTADATWTATVSDSQGSDTAAATLAFRSRRYWGLAAGASLSNADILALGSELSVSGAARKTVTLNPSNQRPVFVQPAAWPIAATAIVNGFAADAFTDTIQTVTNALGFAESYRVRVWNYPLTGATEITW